MQTRGLNLHGYAVFAGVLAAAGLPIYIHAPKVYADTYGVSLAALGTVLFGLRLLDVIQDPLLGRLSRMLRGHKALAVTLGAGVMAGGMVGLFAIVPPVAPLVWFALMLTLVFSAFSFLTINFYAQGVSKADDLGAKGHLRLARWRETGALVGVCIASVLPTAFEAMDLPAFAGFSVSFAGLCLVAIWLMRGEWRAAELPESVGFAPVLQDRLARRLLLIALVNAAPVAVSSTLFLFFVESRLLAPGWEGPLLLLFFLAAAMAAPFWAMVAERITAKRTLMVAMILSIVAFSFALTLGPGDTWLFAAICLASGAALGADLTLLPAMFARRMKAIAPDASEGFALWSFTSKFTLAFAAVALLPILEARGFQTGTENPDTALQTLSLLYALVPCLLKLVALLLLRATQIEED